MDYTFFMPLVLSIATILLLGQFDAGAAGMEPYVFVERGEEAGRLYVLVEPEDLEQTLNPYIKVILDEPWLPEGARDQTSDFVCESSYEGAPGCVDGAVPEGRYFVMGDNRAGSSDSRVFGPIGEDWIVGRAFLTLWPVTRIGFLGPSYTLWLIIGVAVVVLSVVVSSVRSRKRRPRAPASQDP